MRRSDQLQSAHHRVREVDAYVLVTPVYWGDLSEAAKRFTDRLRRFSSCHFAEFPS